ncbi:alpha/beta fold hydrolase [Mycolicibacterium austroafricanum]|uniref:alpha/beta fold hydrolase n=1 Tax=Mycolicibacterium austroafricanum TaxID=39687 RepID=UPI001CA3854F|nr:alpha/beta hydrolase [Mycolicibacterium austroafricanum]QZT63547.1 alpha/beta hydrolase [Mycolicibacterium austroafricanum]
MSLRAPIHLGSGEPVLLLHPFMMSQNVWKDVAPRLAGVDATNPSAPATGRYEVLAPTMPGHNGGVKGRFFLDTAELADDMERRMDALGWDTAHVVGNSLGGWVAFELERRGRVRSLTAIAPAGGWHRWSLPKYEIVFKFVMGFPVWLTAKALGPRAARLPGARAAASVPVSATPDGITDADMLDIIDDVTHCAAYYQLLVKALLLPGLMELADTRIPTHMVICEKDRVLPHPRFVNHFRKHLPESTRFTELDGVGHIPMFEAPGRIADLIRDFLDEQIDGHRTTG